MRSIDQLRYMGPDTIRWLVCGLVAMISFLMVIAAQAHDYWIDRGGYRNSAGE